MTLTYTSRFHSFKPFKQYAPGLGCRGKCEHSDLTIVPKRHKGYTCQAEGIKYCRRCAVYFKRETGLWCPCCNQRLKGRIRSKQSRQYREQVFASKANQEETNIQNLQL